MIFLLRFILVFCTTHALADIVVLEGMSGAGKSTTLINLAPRLQNQFFILSELNPEPDSEWQNDSVEKQGDAFYKLWVERMDILKNSFPESINFLLDRSYIGCLAFTYALDKSTNSNLYENFKSKINKDFNIHTDFSKIIVFDIDPLLSISRRKKAGEANPWPWLERSPWPWDDYQFLTYFREFYMKELPSLTTTEIIYIDTNNLSKEELSEKLYHLLGSYIHNSLPCQHTSEPVSQEHKELLVDFSLRNKLGYYYSEPIVMQGFSSIILERHVLQIDEKGRVVFLNNQRLSNLSNILKD